ncbi:cyclase family protein [Fundidesulfovibrio terrae]|uniref:cyclase family protein n=1 Tax=Fundidesulfovibrio terrae TaxID=2922866 RepID=UPI001FAEE082|nr:cyclase family protein [Fundidesulfovibrio terrae]
MRIIDLTLPLADGMTVYPGDPPVRVRQVHDLASHGWRLHEISLGSHAGTHVNAPWHMAGEGARLEDVPLASFVARAVVRDVSGASLAPGPDGTPCAGASDPGGRRVGSGWPSGLPLPAGVGLIYARAPLDARELPLVLAARPPFVAQAVKFPLDVDVERELCRAGIVSFENLANTAELPRGREFLFCGLPLAVPGDGAPVRAVAILDED